MAVAVLAVLIAQAAVHAGVDMVEHCKLVVGTTGRGPSGAIPPDPTTYPGYHFPAEIISHAVWLHHLFGLSLRNEIDPDGVGHHRHRRLPGRSAIPGSFQHDGQPRC